MIASRPPRRTAAEVTPTQAPYARHIFLCAGQYCDPAGEAPRLYASLARKLGDLAAYDNPERVKRGLAPCLGVCGGGPLLVVYPEGVWYHHVDEAVLDRIVAEHLRDGKPVEEFIFHRLDEHRLDEADAATAQPVGMCPPGRQP